jgi:molybdopterin molybdotransferase
MPAAKILPGYDEALATVLGHVNALGEEKVKLGEARGRVLAAEVLADRDQPPFDRSAMDGFAVVSAEVKAGRVFGVDGGVAAGGARETFERAVPAGMVRRIATGAPLPAGTDAMVPIEQAVVSGEGVSFTVESVKAWQNIHRRASDVKAGGVTVPAGTRLSARHIGLAATSGCVELAVGKMPRVTLLTTGDEVVSPETATGNLGPQQIRNSNGPMLSALIGELGGRLLAHRHLPDDLEKTIEAARSALDASDLVITNGGVSVGERDYLPEAWKRLGMQVILHGVNIQPGKPVFVATDGKGKMVMGLPGNPVSVLCTAHLFVRPVIAAMQGGIKGLAWRKAKLAETSKANAKREMFRAGYWLEDGSVRVIPWQGSGDLAHTAQAEVWVRMPMVEGAVNGEVWCLAM